VKRTFASNTFASNTFGSGNFTGVGVPIEPVPVPCGTDFLQAGMQWLSDQMQTSLSQPVLYQRGSQKIAICATFGQTMLRMADEIGATRIEYTDKDFLIPSSSLVLSGAKFLPRRGDKILHNDGAALHTYEVFPFNDEPPWRFSDPFRTMLRIHAKRLTTEPV
jgi:hypothetical protein